MCGARRVTIGFNFYLGQFDLARFFEYFGSIKELTLYSDPSSKFSYLVQVLFSDPRGYQQFIAWPFPLCVQGVPLLVCDQEECAEPTLDRYSDSEDISLFPEPEPEPGLCLKVNRVPDAWDAFDVYSRVNARFPATIKTAMVSQFQDMWGNKQAVIEVLSPDVAEQLMQEGESVYDGYALEFTLANIDKINVASHSALDSFTIFPFVPSASIAENVCGEQTADDIWADLFSPPFAEADDATTLQLN